LKLLLVEDDPVECAQYVSYVTPLDDVRLIGVTNNAYSALELVRDNIPDVIILDIELHKGSGNGVTFLASLREKHPNLTPYTLVTTNNVSQITHHQVRELGADFVMLKTQEDYSAKVVIDYIRALRVTLHKIQKQKRERGELPEIPPEERAKRLRLRISAEVDKIGLSPKMRGRTYLVEAIMMKIDDQQNIIKTIAKKNEKTDASVERAMQNAINKAWSIMNTEDLENLYTARINPEKGVPTLSEFIWHYTNKLKTEY